jgi:tRNA (uracil-5-)-methyltransferase TRM9
MSCNGHGVDVNAETIRRVNQLNAEFYNVTADSFDLLRRNAWPGWERLPPYLHSPLTVLDVGCGNGRFALFLARHIDNLHYHGIDNNSRLLEHAHTTLQHLNNITLEQRDLIESPLNSGNYDFVGIFGVLHHVPGFAQRLDLMRILSERIKPGGMLAFACWRFYEYERYRERLIDWPENWMREKHDYLLDWKRGTQALRYCHYVDDAEHAALVTATGLTEIETFRSDGEAGNVNRYTILRSDKQ